ncbi:coil containing protein [Vibrio phage 1.015.O._10N.222.51.E5]|nr:coil containing protein [Vibrio phage 1.015.O._10N.222.51.E5]
MKAVLDMLTKYTKPEDKFTDELLVDYNTMLTARNGWEEECRELKEFLDATDTSTTSSSDNEFANTVTIPKLGQIRTNLITNYLGHLFPNREWAQWVGGNTKEETVEFKNVIQGYVRSKLEHSEAETVLETVLEDWVETGLCCTRTRYVTELKDNLDETQTTLYAGAKVRRIHPFNVVYDISADTLTEARKYIREVYSMGELQQMINEDKNSFLTQEQFDEIRTRRVELRNAFNSYKRQDSIKSKLAEDAGFGTLLNYYQGNTVEVILCYGNFYDLDTGELMQNYRITIVDQKEIVEKVALQNVDGGDDIALSVWQKRAGTLAPMSPLASIVGLQHKLDKLENTRADLFDNIANPDIIETGDVQYQPYADGRPGGRYMVEEGGSVQPMRYDTVGLTADTQMIQTMQIMEEMAGAPRESAGFRTPGEKTKYEVQILDGAGSKVFMRKVRSFERDIIRSVLKSYLELGQRYMNVDDIVKVTDSEFNTEVFMSVTRDMLTGQGQILPRGASIMAEKANALQTLTQLSNTAIMQSIAPHVSQKRLARVVEELANLKEFNIIVPNIGIQEQMETQKLMAAEQQRAQSAQQTDPTVTLPSDGEEEGLE